MYNINGCYNSAHCETTTQKDITRSCASIQIDKKKKNSTGFANSNHTIMNNDETGY